jgi:glycosyltransferase involved in cell wall biosynthesis
VFISVLIPAHNPNLPRLRRTLAGLAAQTWPAAQREVWLIDNASQTPLAAANFAAELPALRVVREDRLGLTAARLCGFAAARGDLVLLVDDDNVLAPTYLERVAALFAADPALGAAGGRSLPDFEAPPPAWAREFDGLLALRDPGDQPARAQWTPGDTRSYPLCAPIGAGMALRREAAAAYVAALAQHPERRGFDRTGTRLISGGDNDLVMSVLEAGFAVAYRPELSLLHLIPPRRGEVDYLGELNRAIARSWVSVLAIHGIRLWRPISPRSVKLRQARAWLRSGAWRGPAEWVRWQGLCGRFEGQADLSSIP